MADLEVDEIDDEHITLLKQKRDIKFSLLREAEEARTWQELRKILIKVIHVSL